MKLTLIPIAALLVTSACDAATSSDPLPRMAPQYAAVAPGTRVELVMDIGSGEIPIQVGSTLILAGEFVPESRTGCLGTTFVGKMQGVLPGSQSYPGTFYIDQEIRPGTKLRIVQIHYFCSNPAGWWFTAEVE